MPFELTPLISDPSLLLRTALRASFVHIGGSDVSPSRNRTPYAALLQAAKLGENVATLLTDVEPLAVMATGITPLPSQLAPGQVDVIDEAVSSPGSKRRDRCLRCSTMVDGAGLDAARDGSVDDLPSEVEALVLRTIAGEVDALFAALIDSPIPSHPAGPHRDRVAVTWAPEEKVAVEARHLSRAAVPARPERAPEGTLGVIFRTDLPTIAYAVRRQVSTEPRHGRHLLTITVATQIGPIPGSHLHIDWMRPPTAG